MSIMGVIVSGGSVLGVNSDVIWNSDLCHGEIGPDTLADESMRSFAQAKYTRINANAPTSIEIGSPVGW